MLRLLLSRGQRKLGKKKSVKSVPGRNACVLRRKQRRFDTVRGSESEPHAIQVLVFPVSTLDSSHFSRT